MKKVTLNKKQGLYVFSTEKFVTCLGFEVCIKRRNALAVELGRLELTKEKSGTLKAYKEYSQLLEIAREKNQQTGWRSKSELTPELIGLEGQRVEVITKNDEKIRFKVGKSTGFIPCHLEIKTSRSTGGGAVYGSPFKSVRVI